jgi:phosphopantothenoylcysteine decarboxylase/phosphopantothenate--cysteine ligase
MRILITSGGTEEPLDGVRYITNFSTGRTGALMADRLHNLGAEVILLHGHRAVVPQEKILHESFTSFRDLDEKLQRHLGEKSFDAVIHLAAVSDFSVDYIETESGERIIPREKGKLSSDYGLNVHLKRNYKILDRLQSYNKSGNEILIIGFKLTDTDSAEERDAAVDKLLQTSPIHFLVQNNLRDITENKHPAKIYSCKGDLLYRTETKEELSDRIFGLIKENFKGEHV